MEKKNSYEKAAKKKGLLGEITKDLDTEHNVKNSAIETGKDIIVGVLGGGVVGAFIGKASLLVGAAVTGIGHYTKSRLASIFGIGMMAANGFQKPSQDTVSGTDGKSGNFIEDAKERVMTFKDNFSQKLYLDKLQSKKKEETQSTNKTTSTALTKKTDTTDTATEDKPVGDVQYFIHPSGQKQLDMSKLNQVEDQLHVSAAKFQENGQSTEGLGESDELDPEEKNY